MKVLSMPCPEELVLEERKMPELTGGKAIIKIQYCGICGSDIGAYRGTNPTMRYPITGVGHEGVGVIEEIGVNEKGLKKGDRVALEPYIPCGNCYICKKGGNNCANLHVAGVHSPGMMTEYFSHPVSLLHLIPDDMSMARAALIEPLTIALHGKDRSGVKEGDVCVITGAGPIGILAALSVKAYGATPVLMDVLDSRLEFARGLGIENSYNNSDGGFSEYLQELTDGKLADAMIECTGAPPVLAKLHDYVCNGAGVALVGWPKTEVMVNTVRWMQKELNIRPSRNSFHNFPEAIHLISEDLVPVEQLLTKIIPLEKVEETIRDMVANPSGYMKVVVKVN